MRTMVEDLLELSRIESGRLACGSAPVQLELLAERARQRIEAQAAERRVPGQLLLGPHTVRARRTINV